MPEFGFYTLSSFPLSPVIPEFKPNLCLKSLVPINQCIAVAVGKRRDYWHDKDSGFGFYFKSHVRAGHVERIRGMK